MMSRRMLLLLCMTVSLWAFGLTAEQAQACPNCKAGIATDNAQERAYMYSILFMLAVPATLFTSFGVGFYRLSQRLAEKQAALDPDQFSEQDARVFAALNTDSDAHQSC